MGFVNAHSRSLQLQFVTVARRGIGRAAFYFASLLPAISVSGNLTTCYTTLSQLPISFNQRPKRAKGGFEFSYTPEEEANAQNIRRVISSVNNCTVENVVQSLQNDGFCCQIQLSPPLVDSLLHNFADDWKSALGFFEWARSHMGYKHTEFAHGRMVDLLGKMRQMERMWELVENMHSEGFLTLEIVAKVMRRLTGAKRWKEAIEFFDEVELKGFAKDTEVMNILLDTLCKEKRVDVAREAFEILRVHIAPNACTFNIFVHGWCSADRIEEALWTIQEMKSLGFKPSVITYSIVLKAYCSKLDSSKAYEILNRMIDEDCHPNIITYTTLMNMHAKSEQLDEALNIVERVKSAGCRPDTLFYNSLINILGRAGRLKDACHIYEEKMKMDGVNRNISTYNTMISILCHHKQRQSALNVLEEMRNTSCMPDLQTFRPLLKICFSEGELDDRTHHLLNDIVVKYHLSFDLDAYTTLIHGLCKVGNIGWATLLFDEMVNREIFPTRETCKMLIQEVEKRNMYDYIEKIETLTKQVQSSH